MFGLVVALHEQLREESQKDTDDGSNSKRTCFLFFFKHRVLENTHPAFEVLSRLVLGVGHVVVGADYEARRR